MRTQARHRLLKSSVSIALVNALMCSVWLTGPSAAEAATLPGWSRTCYAPNWMTGVVQPVPDYNVPDLGGYWGFTSRAPGGRWLIRYSYAKISGYGATRAVLQFLYYHECAHARFNTSDERVADCEGLRAMRADVGLTPSQFAEIAATYARVGRPFPSGPCS